MKLLCSRSMTNSCIRLVNLVYQSISSGYMEDQPKLTNPMLTLQKLARLGLITILPLLLYEVGILTFWSFMIGTAPFMHVHEVAWAQDLVLLFPIFCAALFVYYGYYMFLYKEEPKIDVPKYERPRYEKYMYRPEDDRPN